MGVNSVAYLVNQYPKVSHTFIRREIIALEARGWTVHRFALRGWQDDYPDPIDAAEKQKTEYLLRRGPAALLIATLATVATRPMAAIAALSGVLRRARPSFRPLPVHLVYFAEACLLARRLRALDCHHVHAHFGTNSAEVALVAARLAGVRFSFTVHGPEEFDRPEALSLGEKVIQAEFAVAISHFGRSQLMRLLPSAAWPRIHVVRCGLDDGFFPAQLEPPPETLQLVCVGRLCEQKGQLLLIDALAKVRSAGHAVTLVLAGDGEMRAEIEARIARHGLQSSVSITGWVGSDTVARLIRESRAMVLPSFAEGLPVVLMEALAIGRSVVSTFVAGIPELVEPGVNGWLVPAGDVEALTRAIEALATTPLEELARMGQRGRQRAEQYHRVSVQAGLLAELFAGSLRAQAGRSLPSPMVSVPMDQP